jgi:hypothetical protein
MIQDIETKKKEHLMWSVMSNKDRDTFLSEDLSPADLLRLAEKYWPLPEDQDQLEKSEGKSTDELRVDAVHAVRVAAFAAFMKMHSNEPGTTDATQIMKGKTNKSLACDISMQPLNEWRRRGVAYLAEQQESCKSR